MSSNYQNVQLFNVGAYTSNLGIALANYAMSVAETYNSNTVAMFASNAAGFASNQVVAVSDAIAYSSNAATFSSNYRPNVDLAVAMSAVAYQSAAYACNNVMVALPAFVYTSNLGNTTSNQVFPLVQSLSNMITLSFNQTSFASNAAASASNASGFGSNKSVFASNLALSTSNALGRNFTGSNANFVGAVGVGAAVSNSPKLAFHVAGGGVCFGPPATVQASNNNYWGLGPVNSTFCGFLMNETYPSQISTVNWLQVIRNGLTVARVCFPNGNVGIGTLTPGATLDVTGSCRLTSNLIVYGVDVLSNSFFGCNAGVFGSNLGVFASNAVGSNLLGSNARFAAVAASNVLTSNLAAFVVGASNMSASNVSLSSGMLTQSSPYTAVANLRTRVPANSATWIKLAQSTDNQSKATFDVAGVININDDAHEIDALVTTNGGSTGVWSQIRQQTAAAVQGAALWGAQFDLVVLIDGANAILYAKVSSAQNVAINVTTSVTHKNTGVNNNVPVLFPNSQYALAFGSTMGSAVDATLSAASPPQFVVSSDPNTKTVFRAEGGVVTVGGGATDTVTVPGTLFTSNLVGSNAVYSSALRASNVGVGAAPACALDVFGGVANVWAGSRYAAPNNAVLPGSLVVGDLTANFGGGVPGAVALSSNTAGLLFECLDNTEIAVNDAGHRVASLLYYQGGASSAMSNSITIGRSNASGPSLVVVPGRLLASNVVASNVVVGADLTSAVTTFASNTSLYSSNAVVFTSNLTITNSNDIYPKAIFSSNTAIFASNSLGGSINGSNASFINVSTVRLNSSNIITSNIVLQQGGLVCSNGVLRTVSGDAEFGRKGIVRLYDSNDVTMTSNVILAYRTGDAAGDVQIYDVNNAVSVFSYVKSALTPTVTLLGNAATAPRLGVGTSSPVISLHVKGAGVGWQNDVALGTDGAFWGMGPSGSSMYGFVMSDAYPGGGTTNWLKVTRSGMTVSSVALPAGNTAIGGVSPSATLDVFGDAIFRSNVSVTSNATVGSNITVGFNATVASNATVGSNITTTWAAVRSNLTVGSNALVLGALAVTGTLASGSNAAVTGDLSTTRNASVGSNLTVGCNLFVTSNLTVGSNLSVASATVSCNLFVGSNMAIAGSLAMSGNLSSPCNLTVGSNLYVTSNAFVGSNLATTWATVYSNLNVGSNVTIAGTLIITGGLATPCNLSVQSVVVGCNLSVGCNLYVGSNTLTTWATVTSNLFVGSNLAVGCNITTSNVFAGGRLAFPNVDGLARVILSSNASGGFTGLGKDAGALTFAGVNSNDAFKFVTFSGGASNEVVRVTGGGLIGVGTNQPTHPITISAVSGSGTGVIAVTGNANPGDLIARTYTDIVPPQIGDRYGVGQYNNGTTRVFTSSYWGGASIRLSKATNNSTDDAATFTDIVTVLASNGWVGINTNTPLMPLHVFGQGVAWQGQALGGNNTLWGMGPNGNVFYGFLMTDTYTANDSAGKTTNWVQVTRNINNVTSVVFPNGNVGIGTSSPVVPLQVANTVSYNVGSAYYYINDSAGNSGTSAASARNYSILASGLIGCQEINIFSDARIKKNVRAVVPKANADDEAYTKLRVVKYDYVDVNSAGGPQRCKLGLIAQEVEKVLPNVVGRSTHFVPDIFAEATIARDAAADCCVLSLASGADLALQVGDVIRYVAEGDNNRFKEAVVTEVRSPKAVAIDSPDCDTHHHEDDALASGPVFVYGKRVDDFRTIDFDQIAVLTLKAVQNHHRQLQHIASRAPRSGTVKLSHGKADVVLTDGNIPAAAKVFLQNEDGFTRVMGKLDLNESVLRIVAEDASCEDSVSWMLVTSSDSK